MSKLLIKFPSRGRREIFKKTFSLYYDLLSGKHDVEFRVTMDADDGEMNNKDVIDFLDSKKNILYCYGNNTCKVEAINANMEGAEFDVLLLASDDMIPQVQGYDDVIMTKMQEHFPELDGALHFNDGRQGNSLCTLSIMGKKLYDRFGYIYHPDYKSLWCDNEFSDVCRMWGKMQYVDQIIVQHAWVDTTGMDQLHMRNEALFERDKRMFQSRRSAGFPTHSIGAEYDPRRRRALGISNTVERKRVKIDRRRR